MNKKGQILVFFVILIPILLLIAAAAIDMGYSYYQANKINNINRMVIKYGMKHLNEDNLKSKLIDLIYKNDDEIDSYDMKIEDDAITIDVKKTVDSIFGKAVKIDFYYIESKYIGYIKDGKVYIEKR